MKKFEAQINTMLMLLGEPECKIDDGICYLDNGYFIAEEYKPFTWKTIGGERSEMKLHYVVYKPYIEYNYPHEPDYEDVMEIHAYIDVTYAVRRACVDGYTDKIDDYLESLCDFDEVEETV